MFIAHLHIYLLRVLYFLKKNLNCDIFSELDFFWCNYLNQGGHLFLLPDFIENYSLHDDVLDGLFTYTAD